MVVIVNVILYYVSTKLLPAWWPRHADHECFSWNPISSDYPTFNTSRCSHIYFCCVRIQLLQDIQQNNVHVLV